MTRRVICRKNWLEKNITKMDRNSKIKIIKDHLSSLEGYVFQDLCNRLCYVLYPNDYSPVRPGGNKGDLKNDGYCPEARIFFAAHATRGEYLSKIKRKIKEDLEGCINHHDDVETWIYLTNDTLTGEVEKFIDELRKKYPKVKIDTWNNEKIALKIDEQTPAASNYITDINYNEKPHPTTPQGKPTITIADFLRAIETFDWQKEFINHQEVWIYRGNNLLQIKSGNNSESFTEKWTQVYPDKFGSSRHYVYLKAYGVTIKQIPFISCDGGRIFVPMPEFRVVNDKIEYYWNKNSLEFKLGQLIGDFYAYGSIDGVAAMSKIRII